ncbi:MAG: 6-bladed beta-propeller [Acidobacteria bacterium]|nr:6-bladed beta-propeller [Acidobacteriota bacterium]
MRILVLFFAASAFAQTYRLVPEWPLPAKSAAGAPAGPWNLIQVAGTAIDSRGHVLVLHRGAHPILEFTESGEFVRSWGDGLISHGKVVAVEPRFRAPGASGYSAVYGPAACYACGGHAIRVTSDGNIWVADAPGHVVYKTTPEGKVILTLGTKGAAGLDKTHFNLPTDLAVAPNGDIYVSDGYGNPRVVRFSARGQYIGEWGKRGTGPGEFGLPHSIVVDRLSRVYVADRDNRRVQVFDAAGKFLAQWDTGGVSPLLITPDQKIWTGDTLRDLNGKALTRLPGNPGGHGIAVGRNGAVYVAQLNGVVQKFEPN